MERAILFSIVIPTYNRASFIRKTIESALTQEYDNFEIIVVDDGSTDNTEEIVAGIKDPRIRYHKIKNSERGAARNYGASIAAGHYVNFFDSDDIVYPNHLSEAYKLIERHQSPEFINISFDVRDPEGKLISKARHYKGDLNLGLIKKGNLISCNGVFLRKDISQKHPFNEDRKLSGSEDYELWLRLSSEYPIYYSNAVSSSIINHDDRSVLQMNREKLIVRFSTLVECLMQQKKFVEKFGKYKNNLLANNYTYISLHIALAGDHKLDTIRYLTKAISKKPQLVFSKRFFAIIKHLIIS
ncbi:MAG: glycosyltransferase family 2 protein [Bacteroidia bacterium]